MSLYWSNSFIIKYIITLIFQWLLLSLSLFVGRHFMHRDCSLCTTVFGRRFCLIFKAHYFIYQVIFFVISHVIYTKYLSIMIPSVFANVQRTGIISVLLKVCLFNMLKHIRIFKQITFHLYVFPLTTFAFSWLAIWKSPLRKFICPITLLFFIVIVYTLSHHTDYLISFLFMSLCLTLCLTLRLTLSHLVLFLSDTVITPYSVFLVFHQ